MRLVAFARLTKVYRGRLARFLRRSMNQMGEIPKLAEQFAQEIIDDPMFQRAALALGRQMAEEVAHVNAASWREAAAKSTNARRIYAALKDEIARAGLEPTLRMIARRNAELIQSIPRDVARQVTEQAAEMQRAGARPEAMGRKLRAMLPTLADNRIHLIARTEISRAETDVTRARAEKLDANWYQWATSEDQRVRKSHRNMDKVLVAWQDAPSPERLIGEKSTLGEYHAGSCPSCRCAALPLISLDEVSWPCRVYSAGRITRMTRAAFTRLNTVRIAA